MMPEGAAAIAAAVRAGEISARAVTEAALTRIAERNGSVNAFTVITADRALAEAAKIDAAIKAGRDPGPLAGVPFAVKNLFDIVGVTTLAGSKILANRAPAREDAAAVRLLCEAGAVLVGGLNMEEFAYGFLTDNAHYGRTLNPHDPSCTAGGSSGGSSAAVAAGLVPVALGTDTNGSIRVPSAFCGVVGLKPTYGRIDRSGMVFLAPSLDHVGPFARTVGDVASVFGVLSGAPVPAVEGRGELRIGIAGGYFDELMSPRVRAAVERAGHVLGATRQVEIPAGEAARAAAYVITSCEAAELQMEHLRRRPMDFDPAIRDRLLAGALLPGEWYLKAQRFRTWFRQQVRALFAEFDVIIAPTAPFEAPRFGEETMLLDGIEVPVRPTIGRFTQPLSLIGVPILAVPVPVPGDMPVGVQLIGRSSDEAAVLCAGRRLEERLRG